MPFLRTIKAHSDPMPSLSIVQFLKVLSHCSGIWHAKFRQSYSFTSKGTCNPCHYKSNWLHPYKCDQTRVQSQSFIFVEDAYPYCTCCCHPNPLAKYAIFNHPKIKYNMCVGCIPSYSQALPLELGATILEMAMYKHCH